MIRFASWRVVIRLFFISAMLALPVAAYSQEATINGTITDATGAILPGVSVTAGMEEYQSELWWQDAGEPLCLPGVVSKF